MSRRRRRVGGVFCAALITLGVAVGIACASSEKPSSRTASNPISPPSPLPSSAGQAFYVATTGDDAAAGSVAMPWRTIQKAIQTLKPGQRALVRSGTYTEDLVVARGGTAKQPITIAAYTGERPVLHAASASGDTYPLRITSGAAYVRVRGFTIEGARGTSSTNVYFQGSAHHIELSGNVIRYSQDQGIFSERTTSHLYLVRNRIHDNGRGHEPGQHQSHGIYLEGTDHYVANNAVHDHPHGFGIQIYPANSRSLIVNNTVVGSGHAGVVVGGRGGVSAITIRNNILAFNASYGVQMDSACPDGPVLVDTNVIYGNRNGSIEGGCVEVDASRGNIQKPPRLVSVQYDDLRLRRGSPAIDRARSESAPRNDFNGLRRPIGAGTDIGAFERDR